MAPGPTPLVQKPHSQRYRRGKLPSGAPIPSDDSSEEEEEQQQQPARGAKRSYVDDDRQGLVSGGAGRIITSASDLVSSVKAGSGTGKRGIQVALRDVKVEEDGALLIGGKREVGRTEMEASSEEEDDEDAEDEDAPTARPAKVSGPPGSAAAHGEESSEYETDSGEEESSEEEPPKPVYRPTFVPKRARETVIVKEAEAQEEEELWKKREEEAKQRKKESRNLVGESIRRELAEKEASENVPDVDDTDDLDPEAEFEAWRLRELSRLTRDKEAALLRREEQEEIERRRALPEAQRLREDEEHARKTREEKDANRGERGFMEKFYHKGAFYQEEDILKRNYNVKTESAVDVSLLPKAMQVRNFGKASRSKYTHLKDQDTTQGGWDRALHRGPAAGLGQTGEGCFNCGGPHLKRDCPNTDAGRMDGPSASGTNTSNLGGSSLGGQRAWGAPRADRDVPSREGREPYPPRNDRDSEYASRPRPSDHDVDRQRERYGRDDRDNDGGEKGRSYDDGRDRGGSRADERRTRRTSRSRSPGRRRDDYRERDRDRDRDMERDYRR